MDKIIGFFQSEFGRRLSAWALGALSLATQGGLVPLDYAIPFLGITTGQLFMFLGLGVASTSGSSARK